MKRVVGIIGTNGLPGKYGGWDQLVDHLTKQLNGDVSFIVYTSYTSADPNIREVNRAKIKSIPFKANGIQSIPYDILSMIHAGFFCDVLFICGTSGCIALPAIGMFGKKIILNPDGQEWKRKKWSKPVKWFLKISELFGAHFSSTLVADNVIIQKYLKSKYGKESVLIEYGGDQVVKVEMKSETSKKYAISAGKYAFKVCRIEPENNIHLILDAFKHVREMNLVIVGNWNYSEYGKRLRRYYLEFQNIKMVDPIY